MAKKPTHIEAVIKTLTGDDVLGMLRETNKGLGELRTFLAKGHKLSASISKKLNNGQQITAKEKDRFADFLEDLSNRLDKDWPGNGGPIAGH